LSHMFGYVEQKLLYQLQKNCFSWRFEEQVMLLRNANHPMRIVQNPGNSGSNTPDDQARNKVQVTSLVTE
jgi:hypothetical protein